MTRVQFSNLVIIIKVRYGSLNHNYRDNENREKKIKKISIRISVGAQNVIAATDQVLFFVPFAYKQRYPYTRLVTILYPYHCYQNDYSIIVLILDIGYLLISFQLKPVSKQRPIIVIIILFIVFRYLVTNKNDNYIIIRVLVAAIDRPASG